MNNTISPEQLEETRRACGEGRFPDPEVWLGPRRPDVAQPGVAADVFTANDLTLDLISQGQEYRVPTNGKRLWIFPVTSEDTEFMLAWSLLPESLAPDPSDPHRANLAQARLMQDLKLAQVARCTRTGPARSSPPCFDRRDIPAIRSRLGSSIVEEIVRISNELSGNEEALGGSTRRFFGVIRASLQTSLSVCDTWDACPAGLIATQKRLLSLVTRAALLGRLDSGLMSELGDLEMSL